MHVLSDKSFKERAREGDSDLSNVVTRKQFACDEVKAINRSKRQIDFVISTESPDRMNDVIKTDGWELEAYKKNPVVLFAHDNRSPPVAKAIDVKKRPRKKQLTARAEFAPADVSPFSETLFNLYDKGFMKATSVGFRPIEISFSTEDDRPGGIDFEEAELLEFSLVPVPANSEALISASKSVDMKPMVGWAERILDEWEEYKGSGLHVPRRAVEKLYKDAKGTKSYDIPVADQMNILRHNMSRIESQLRSNSNEEDKDMSIERDYKGAISYEEAHPKGTPTADKECAWDSNSVEKALADTEKDDTELFERVYAYHDVKDDDNAEEIWKFPHHQSDEDNSVVWSGVKDSAAKLPIENIPDDEVPGVQDHLGRHYEEFDETAPWDDEKLLPDWQAYVKVCQEGTEESKSNFDEAAAICRKLFGEDVSKKLFSSERRKELFDDDSGSDPSDKDHGTDDSNTADGIMEKIESRVEEVRKELRDEFEKELDKEKERLLGGDSLYDIAAKFLDSIDDAIENDNIPETTRKDKRILRDTAESMNELFLKITGENAVDTSHADNIDARTTSKSNNSVDDDDLDFTIDDVEEILDKKDMNQLIKEAVDEEIDRIQGKVN